MPPVPLGSVGGVASCASACTSHVGVRAKTPPKESSPAQTSSRGRQLASDWPKQTRFNMHVLLVLPAYVARLYIQ